MNTEEILKAKLAECDQAAAKIEVMRAAMPKLVPVLNTLPSLRFCYYYPESAKIILSVKTRADFATVRALKQGVWEKDEPPIDDDPHENIRYIADVFGVNIDVRVSELPPSCCIVEEHKLVPEHTVKIRRLVCNEPSKADASKADKILSVERVEEAEPVAF